MANSKPNYGDVALNLPPDWSRARVQGPAAFTLTTVGHVGGVADAYLTNDPSKEHQFRWCDPRDYDAVSDLRTKKYAWCTKDLWTKNDDLWEWDGDGWIVRGTERLMARDGIHYFEEIERQKEEKKRQSQRRSLSDDEEAAMRRVEARGGTIEDERGRQLTPLSNKR